MVLTLSDFIKICDVESVIGNKDVLNTNISYLLFDSRRLNFTENTIFFALKTQNNDGHKFIKELYEKGLRCFICQDLPDITNLKEAVFLKVKDSLKALQQLATFARESFNKEVIAITGSNGKTIVKEWIVQLIENNKKICYSPRSYNSQIGVALSLWQLNEEFELGLFEAGISKPNEMEKLQEMIKPTIGIFTNIGSAHQVNFSSLDEKIEEKLKLFTNCKTLICSQDDEYLFNKVNTWCKSRNIEIITFKSSELSKELNITFKDKASIENLCLSYVTALYIGADENTLKQQINNLSTLEMRLQLKEGLGEGIVINDSYCFDLTSLEAALDYLNQHNKSLSKVAILSPMAENQNSELSFKQINSLLCNKGINEFYAIGKDFLQYKDIFTIEKTHFFSSVEEFTENFSIGDFYSKAILIKGARTFNMERISNLLESQSHQTILEVNLSALNDNVKYFKSLLKPSTKIMAMVKASSYGCGAYELAKDLEHFSLANYFTVAFADEALLLRKNGIKSPIVVVTPEKEALEKMIKYDIEVVVHNFSTLNMIKDCNLRIHLKIDSGMHRLGFEKKDLNQLIAFLKEHKNLKIASVFSHLACADSPELDFFTNEQINSFEQISQEITTAFDYKILRHICNSAASVRFPQVHYDMIRLGIGMYGIGVNEETQKHLRYVHKLQSRLSEIRTIEKGEGVSYMRRFVADKQSKIGVIPIGYADGLNRHLSEKGFHVWINGKLAPIIGSICMDMCMIDLSNIEAKVGDKVVIFGEENPVENMANALNTISYEIFTSVSQRIKRVYYHE
ncbi:MAG: bifunctional UDP-N-acetylmuramoyl-tripeptide:D-alanyl-D-alanine ligase/alanine racemase [Bacteroidales bacterium]|nr:bifunctional UDP-N-acetylmuramoyl-tripeptide:D-alanyl-D-alanine ligase/alanine racemase [Bacteroidales bacterium]